ncbi:hypothetical protein KIH87_13825 [Paraneptunicella aestuarii]|uniref:hypothetical protein n=1 Tax=Paraneptunicella aestuarii TaxID=2831148 RepID=UPI001E639A3E|nr:hypothetical protein [Paraneptunicella aestuarii]UAA37776.1 hypothetical protein KIH87_13825 [Paraneptunicella aestuarii]
MFWATLKPQKGKEDEYARHPDVIDMSKGEVFLAACMSIFRHAYGFVAATDNGLAANKEGDSLPLYTYPAIEYINQFDYSQKRVFEFGSGASTLFWMKRAQSVYSLENDQGWLDKMQPQLQSNAQIKFVTGDDFPFAIHEFEGLFDVIVVDSAGYRFDCAQQALKKLAPGGFIILDNADWHHKTAALLKAHGLFQVDMSGFKPCESHTSTTSLFFDRTFDFPTIEKRQPSFAMGAKRLHSADWDKPYAKNK